MSVHDASPLTRYSAELMSTAEVAAHFGRTTRTISNWVRAGLLHPKRVGGSVYFIRKDILALAGEENTISQEVP